jgi:hypothetical protein
MMQSEIAWYIFIFGSQPAQSPVPLLMETSCAAQRYFSLVNRPDKGSNEQYAKPKFTNVRIVYCIIYSSTNKYVHILACYVVEMYAQRGD